MKRRERGSALLIVFVFAAIVAIMLMKEMPVVTFEAQRDKEQLLVDRGNEYKHAIKLYVRKFQTFPQTVEALENTNRMRFLRHKYTDPFSGKDDWRFLHAGLGGMITDSKIKPKGKPGQNGQNGLSTPYSPTDTSSATNNSDPNSVAINNQPMPAAFPQRPPATGYAGPAGGPSDGSMPTDPQQTAVPYPGYPGPPNGAPMNGTASGPFPMPSRYRGGPPGMSSYAPGGNGYPPPGVTTDMQNGQGNSQDPQSSMNALLSNNNSAPPGANQPSSGGAFNNGASGFQNSGGAFNNGQPNNGQPGLGSFNNNNSMGGGGGIAGIASHATHRTIKIVNDQTDISLWEFVYDMRKEMMANAPGMNGMNGGNGNGGFGGNNGNSGFGGNSGNSSFGGSSSFGQSNNNFNSNVNQTPPQTLPQ